MVTTYPSIGTIKRNYIYKHRMISITSLYILSIPLKRGKMTGKVVAYHFDTGEVAWTCHYEDGLANGTYKHYENGKMTCSYPYFSPLVTLRDIATNCAEYVLN